jgi:tetratricopeptide (TPR) repeat protein
MAKPMLVTLPFVLLLLDYWPLDRISRFQWKIFYRLILEKIPFIVLSVVFSVMTFIAQRNGGVVIEFTNLGMKYRIYNAFISYIIYIGKLFRPSHLAVFYPHPVENVPILYAVISAAALLAVTIFVIRFAQNRRYLVTGWFWYLGTLVPVIGIIQVGSQAYADRYTYIPYIGLFIMLAWGLPQLLSKLPQRKIALGVSIVIVLTTLGICAHRQTSYWKNSITLFSHANQVTQNNYLAYYDLGVSYGKLGRITEAIEAYKNAVRIKPAYVEAYYNLGNACSALGRYTEAIEVYKQAIRIQPDLIDAHNNLGIAYCALGRWPEAIEAYNQAIRIQPDDPGAHYNLGNAYCAIGRWSEAIEAYKNAIRIKPDLAEAHTNLGIVYRKLGRFTEAIDAYKQAIKIKPNFAEAYANLGIAYLAIGDKNSAMAEYNILKSLNSEMASKLLNQINK